MIYVHTMYIQCTYDVHVYSNTGKLAFKGGALPLRSPALQLPPRLQGPHLLLIIADRMAMARWPRLSQIISKSPCALGEKPHILGEYTLKYRFMCMYMGVCVCVYVLHTFLNGFLHMF